MLPGRYPSIFLELDADDFILARKTAIMSTADLGETRVTEAFFENPDGSDITLDHDFFGAPRGSNPKVGPFENLKPGMNEFTVWKF